MLSLSSPLSMATTQSWRSMILLTTVRASLCLNTILKATVKRETSMLLTATRWASSSFMFRIQPALTSNVESSLTTTSSSEGLKTKLLASPSCLLTLILTMRCMPGTLLTRSSAKKARPQCFVRQRLPLYLLLTRLSTVGPSM